MQYTYLTLYTEQGLIFRGQYKDWMKTDVEQFEENVAAGVKHMLREANENNHVSEPLRQHTLSTYS